MDLASEVRIGEYIRTLERACAEEPYSADLRTCLGMAHARNGDTRLSLEALERARQLDPHHFFAQFQYAQLLLSAGSPAAAAEMLHALELARNPWEVSMVCRQLVAVDLRDV